MCVEYIILLLLVTLFTQSIQSTYKDARIFVLRAMIHLKSSAILHL